MAGLLLAGDVYIDRFTDAGSSTGLIGPLNATSLTISNPEPEKKERISNKRDSLGQALDVVQFPKPPEISISIDEQPAEVLAMALLGSVLPHNQTSGSVTDAPVTLIPGRWVTLPHQNINSSGFEVAKESAPGTPLVEGTDYVVNRAAGLVMAVVGGAVTGPTPCLIDYGYSAAQGTLISGSTRPIIRCRIYVDGKNLASGNLCLLDVYDSTLSPAGEIDLLNREFVTTVLKGTLRTPPGKTEPYRFVEYA